MATSKAPKQWPLTKNETITSFEAWKQNLTYILSLDVNFAPFLKDDCTWRKKSTVDPDRGFADDDDAVPVASRKSAAQKVVHLDLMLGQIANFCPVISRNTIIKTSTSLKEVWHRIRAHFGFQTSGSHFLDLSSIKLQSDERHEDLFQRITAFFEDNLLTTSSAITHHGEPVTVDEDITPTLENMIVYMWLNLINPQLPGLVKQTFGTELRNKTLSSIKPEISQALSSLLDELHNIDEIKYLRTFTPVTPQTGFRNKPKPKSFKSCVLCKTGGRPHTTHNLSECRHLPEADKRYMARARLTTGEQDDVNDDSYLAYPEDDTRDGSDDNQGNSSALLVRPVLRRVEVIQSPYLNTFFGSTCVRLVIDTGATTNMVRRDFALRAAMPIRPASQRASQADGVTPLSVQGEVHCQLTIGQHTFELDALVVDKLDVDILAGTPFLTKNDIATRPALCQILINGTEEVYYGKNTTSDVTVRRTQCHTVRGPPHQSVILPGEFFEVETPKSVSPDNTWALEPRHDSSVNRNLPDDRAWPQPQEIDSVDNTLRLVNNTSEPITIRRNEHFCQIREISCVSPCTLGYADQITTAIKSTPQPKPFATCVTVDPDHQLSPDVTRDIHQLHRQFDNVFNPTIGQYNGNSGKIEAVVNMGPALPPQRKGRLPQYNRERSVQLQEKFDELEKLGVFAKPEDVGVTVEYLNISFLVNKPNGGTRLVTSFGEVAQYSKPQPSLMPSVESVLRDIAKWRYLIMSDLHHAFYQIPLAKDSMKFCGVVTPFKGVRVYTRSAMGMPGSETCLEELLSRVLGPLIEEGCVVKLADDLYCGGDTAKEAMYNWSRVLSALSQPHTLCSKDSCLPEDS